MKACMYIVILYAQVMCVAHAGVVWRQQGQLEWPPSDRRPDNKCRA